MSSMFKSKMMVGNSEKVVVVVNHNDEEVIDQTTKVEVNQLHHIHVIDRSGSMCSSLSQLIDTVKQTFNVISDNDLITLIWFSGSGQNRTVVKGATKSEKLDNILDTLRSTVGCTCFSEPLKEINLILDEIGDLAPVSVNFFTDGYPVVPWSDDKEHAMCYEELDKMKDRIMAFSTIGFGNNYNQELLRSFSSKSEYGVSCHANKIDDYLSIFSHNFEKINDAVCESITIDAPSTHTIYLNRTFTKHNVNGIHLSRIDKRKNQFFLFTDSGEDFNFTVNGVEHNSNDIKINMNPATKTNFYYALAYNLYYVGERKQSLDVLSNNIHDKALIDSHMSAFTFNETADHLSKLEDALFHNEMRLADGVAKDDYIPADDAPCMMDVLKKLQEGDSLYIPFSKNVAAYKRIGKKATDSFDLFTKCEEEVRVPFTSFVFNKSQMNMSVLCKIQGTVQLNPKQAKAVALPTVVDSYIWRAYSILKDGNINIPEIEVLLTDSDFIYRNISDCVTTMIEHVVIDGVNYSRCIMDLTALPIINRSYVDESINIDTIFTNVVEMAKLEARQKIINDMLSVYETPASTTKIASKYNEEQINVLALHGIAKDLSYGGIDVTTKSNAESDFYYSRTIEFVLAGLSSLPKVYELNERLASGKKLTTGMEYLKEAQDGITDALSKFEGEYFTEEIKHEWLVKIQKHLKAELNRIRTKLAIMKIALVLTGDTIKGLQVDDKNNYYYESGGIKMNVKLDRKKEYY